MPRYYSSEDYAANQFAAWSLVLVGSGLVALMNALRPRPDAYYPKAPDDPTQIPVVERFLKGNTLDVTRAKLPKVDLSDLKNPIFNWRKEDRPQLVKAEENPYPFVLPIARRGATVIRIIPAKIESQPENSMKLMQALLASCPKLSFEIVADSSGIFWQICDLENQYAPELLAMHVKSYHPQADIAVLPDTGEMYSYPFYRQMVLFGLANEYAAPLPFLTDYDLSPLAVVVNRMDLLNPDLEERIRYRLVTYTRTIEAENRAGKRIVEDMVKPTSGVFTKNDPFAGLDPKLLNAKLDLPHYHAFLSLTVESWDEGRLPILTQAAKDLMAIATPRHNSIVTVGNQVVKHIVETPDEASLLWFETLLTTMVRRYMDEWRKLLMVLTPPELATLWHLPDERFIAKHIVWATASVNSALTKTSEQAVCIGDAVIAGQKTPVYAVPAQRINHSLIVGKNGVGKSTLIHALAHQDIAAGRGVVVIDPHGELVNNILTQSIPATRCQDVVMLDCGKSDFPVPLNPFRMPEGVSFDYANTYLYWVLRKIYDSIWVEGRMDFTMRNVLQALLCDPEATPLDISRLFSDEAYRTTLTQRLEDNDEVSLAVINYWQNFESQTRGEQSELSQPIINRTGAFVGKRALELMTCHPNTLNFKELISQKKIVLISLEGDAIKTEANNLGAILLSHFYLASLSLGVLPAGQLPRCYLHIDEADRFVSSPLPDMFSEARKYGLALTLATQFLSRLPKDTQEGIFGNVGTQYLFEVGEQDAHTLEKYVKPLTSDDLINVGKFRMVVKTRAEGNTQPGFVVATRDIPKSETQPCEPSSQTGFLPKAEVLAWLKARYTPPKPKPSGEEGKPTSTDNLEDFE